MGNQTKATDDVHIGKSIEFQIRRDFSRIPWETIGRSEAVIHGYRYESKPVLVNPP
jgi:hypothetical protein